MPQKCEASQARAPAVHKVFILNTRPFKAGCLRFGTTTLCLLSQPMKWGCFKQVVVFATRAHGDTWGGIA